MMVMAMKILEPYWQSCDESMSRSEGEATKLPYVQLGGFLASGCALGGRAWGWLPSWAVLYGMVVANSCPWQMKWQECLEPQAEL